MNPIVHAELSWLVLAQPLRERRDRALVVWAGLLPDADGLTLAAYPFDQGLAYSHYHHLLTHSLPVACLVSAGAAALATRGSRAMVAALAFAAFHLHLVCDLLGSGKEWPFSYLFPFADYWIAPFSFGWELASRPNQIIGILAMAAVLVMGALKGRTVLEAFWPRGEAVLGATLRKWAGRPAPAKT